MMRRYSFALLAGFGPYHIFGPGVTPAATSVRLGRISKLSTLLPVEPCRLVIVALLVAARSAVITNGAWVFGFRNMFEGTSLSSSRAFADTYAPGEGRLADESLREKFIGLILGLVL